MHILTWTLKKLGKIALQIVYFVILSVVLNLALFAIMSRWPGLFRSAVAYVTMTPDIAEGALTMGSDPMFRVDKGGPPLDISGIKIYQVQSGILVPVEATCSHQIVDVAAVNNSCTTITPGGIAGCEWVTVSYPGARPTRFKIFNWENGATGPCS